MRTGQRPNHLPAFNVKTAPVAWQRKKTLSDSADTAETFDNDPNQIANSKP